MRENIEIRFRKVIEDSRCTKDVTWVWEGRLICLLEITISGVSSEVTLTQSGLTDKAA